MSLIDDIKRDREAGSKTAWHLQSEEAYDGRSTTRYQRVFDEELNAICDEEWGAHNDGGTANMRRIARVPDMETALLAAEDALNRINGTLTDYGKQRLPEYVRKEIGEALAAYRKATGASE